MAVRPIDGNALIEWFRPYLHTGEAIPADVVIEDIRSMPTLTPQNEALTIEQLREMDGEPVWVDDKKTWALLQVWDDKNIDVVFPMPKGCFHAKSVNGRKIYRRPPEGRSMSAKNVKGPFWSNCLLEAAKAKIRHPVKVKVTVVPRSEARCPHFLWSDGEYDYDFGVERRLVGAQILLFRGYIRRRGLGFNQKYKERMRKAWRRLPEGEEDT